MAVVARVGAAVLAALCIGVAAGPVAAQSQRPGGAPCVTKPAELKERVAELSAPDPLRRLAMFNEMLISCDPAQRELAYERGFASAEHTVRALTLRAKLRDAKVLILELTAPEGDQHAASIVKQLGGGYVEMPVAGYDADKGELRLGGFVSRVSGTMLSLIYGHCRGVMNLADGSMLAGTVSCLGVPIKGVVRL